jgi:hypothetical protein
MLKEFDTLLHQMTQRTIVSLLPSLTQQKCTLLLCITQLLMLDYVRHDGLSGNGNRKLVVVANEGEGVARDSLQSGGFFVSVQGD